jgi:hypothetical protein
VIILSSREVFGLARECLEEAREAVATGRDPAVAARNVLADSDEHTARRGLRVLR